MGAIGAAVDSIVGMFRGITIAATLALILVLWALPTGMLWTTKLVVLTVIVSTIYDDVLRSDDANFTLSDLFLTGAVSYGTLRMVSK